MPELTPEDSRADQVDELTHTLARKHMDAPANIMNRKPRRTFWRTIWLFIKAIFYVHAGFLLLVLACCFLLKFINPWYTPWMLYRWLGNGWKPVKGQFIPSEKMPKSVKDMAVLLEDGKFYDHWGFDVEAIQKAYQTNERKGHIRVGGSTISQQVARTLFLTNHRNYLRKYLEAWITLELELCLPKDRILELYLNYVEWGRGIYGLDAAAQTYYQAGGAKLGVDQYRRLLSILSNPIKFRPRSAEKYRSAGSRYRYLQSVY